MNGDIQVPCSELLIQISEAQNIDILKRVVSADHIHMHIEYATKLNVSSIVKSLKGQSSLRLQQEYPSLKRNIEKIIFWASDYSVWSSGNITDKMVNQYLEHHRAKGNDDNSDFILE